MDIENYTYLRSIFIKNGEKLKFKMGQSISDDNYLSGSVYLIEEGSARVIYKEGNKFNCTVIFNGETFQASAGLKKESEQKVSELILERVNEL